MSKKEFIKLLEFICSVGGSDYYQELYSKMIKSDCNISDIENFNELKCIAELFKTWIKEYTWSKEDTEYMAYIINIAK